MTPRPPRRRHPHRRHQHDRQRCLQQGLLLRRKYHRRRHRPVVTATATGQLTILPTASGTANSGAQVVASPDPAGVNINLQGISYANNNPDLLVRLVTNYDSALPAVTDGNPASGVPYSHGQYASGLRGQRHPGHRLGQLHQLWCASTVADGQNFTLTFAGQTTSTITYSSNATTMAANIQTALQALSNIGAGNVTVASTIALNNYTPPGPITSYNGFSVIFSGTLKDTAEPTMTISDANDNVATWQTGTPSTIASTVTAPYTLTAYQPVTLAVASTTGFTVNNPVLVGNITADISAIGSGTITVTPQTSGSVLAGTAVKQLGVTGFVDGGGSWEMGNITFSGDTTTGVPGIVTNPTSQTVAAGYPVTFTATAYSESVPTVTWQYSTNGVSWTTVTAGTVTPTGGTFTASANNDYTSTYSFVTDSNQDQNGYQYRAVFANGAGPPIAPAAPSLS